MTKHVAIIILDLVIKGMRIQTGSFSPHIWAGFVGASLFAFGLLVLVTGMIGQMLKRIRLNQEMILYHHRKKT